MFHYSTHTKYYILLILFVAHGLIKSKNRLYFHNCKSIIRTLEDTPPNEYKIWLTMCIICLVCIDCYCFRNSIFKFKFGKVYNGCRNCVCAICLLKFVKTLKINYMPRKEFYVMNLKCIWHEFQELLFSKHSIRYIVLQLR